MSILAQRAALSALSRARLSDLAGTFDLELSSRASKGELVEALAGGRKRQDTPMTTQPHRAHPNCQRNPQTPRGERWLTSVIIPLTSVLVHVALWLLFAPAIAAADEPVTFDTLAAEYKRDVRPLLQRFCLECHSSQQKEGDLDLQRFASLAEVRRGTKVWLKVVEMLDNGEMPPKDADQPSLQQRQKLRAWAERYLYAEALANAGDPGPVVLRRLNNAEYTYTIRDLTGVDLNPARQFPTEGAAGEGFTNAGGALVMSPALLRKYIDAGKEIAGHAVLRPGGFRFSPHATRRDWTDELLAKIRGFYRDFVDTADLGAGEAVGNLSRYNGAPLGHAGRLPLEKYLAATIAKRQTLSSGAQTIEVVAREQGLNAKYLGILWSHLTRPQQSMLLEDFRGRWSNAKPADAKLLAAEVAPWQRGLWIFNPVGLLGRKGGPSRWMEAVDPLATKQELRLPIPAAKEKTNQDAKKGETPQEIVLSLVATDAGDGNEQDFVVWHQPRLVAAGKPDILLRDVQSAQLTRSSRQGDKADEDDVGPAIFGRHPSGRKIDAASLCVHAPAAITIRLPAESAAGREFVTTAMLEQESAAEGSVQVELVAGVATSGSGLRPSRVSVQYSKVTQIFPERRDVLHSRPVLVGENSAARKRFQAAMDDHRRLFPAALCYLQIVPVDELLSITLFHREDEHLARLMLDEAQQALLDEHWTELRFASREPPRLLDALELLIEALEGNNHPDRSQYNAIAPMREPFRKRVAAFRQESLDSEPGHLDALVAFTARAYRRPLSDQEAAGLRALYRQLREQELPHDAAFRMTLAKVFAASPFLYRFETAPEGSAAAPVSDWELANRLSYFLWSSMPDDELRAAAANGTLHESAVLAEQTRRMLKDARVRRLATQFGCQWLHIHDFDPLEKKSEKHFPEFAELRGDMYEESILYLTDLFQRDGSLLGLLNADHTFVNERLAKFYAIPEVTGAAWRRVEGIRQHGRGGILGLATTLAKQSGATRTSPILRGNWISEVLLGEKLPRPPKNVPQLAETLPAGLTERQLIERHSSDAACAKCHARIDPFGFALEQYDAIGRRREKNAGGLAIDSRTTLPDGTRIEGLAGLRDYLLENRRDTFLRQFCRKLLGYAIGRELQLSDDPLLNEIMTRLAKQDFRFSVVVEAIVSSQQFRMIRGRGMTND